MLVGIALYELGKVTIDKTLIAFTVVATYVLWPAVAALCITLDRSFTHFYNLGIYRIILLLSIVPVGASIVALSTELRVEPQKLPSSCR